MKTLKNLALSLIIFTVLFSCTKEEDVIPTSPIVVVPSDSTKMPIFVNPFVEVLDTTWSTANVRITAISDNGSTITERGFCYSSSNNKPTISDSKLELGAGSGNISGTLINLNPNTQYYVRAYAVNQYGCSYSEMQSFITDVLALPTANNTTFADITYKSVTINSSVSGDLITERGIVYSTSQNPTISNTKVLSNSNTISLSLDLLASSTTFYVRSFATNATGTVYGTQTSFTTNNCGGLADVVLVNYTNFNISANVNGDGGSTVTERGFIFSVNNTDPTMQSHDYIITSTTTGTGLYDANISNILSNLQTGDKLSVKAYAVNYKGTSVSSVYTITK